MPQKVVGEKCLAFADVFIVLKQIRLLWVLNGWFNMKTRDILSTVVSPRSDPLIKTADDCHPTSIIFQK